MDLIGIDLLLFIAVVAVLVMLFDAIGRVLLGTVGAVAALARSAVVKMRPGSP